MDDAKVLIIGSGPAGYTAAIYAARANLQPILVEGGFDEKNQSLLPGGQLMITTEVENFPGFPEGIQGPELMEHFKKQALRFGTRIINGFVTKVHMEKRPFVVEVEGEPKFTAGAVIISTGAVAKLLEIPGERTLMGHGVSACATCDGAFFKNQQVVVVGGGDTAMEEALFLTRFAEKVIIVHRRDTLRASKVMQARALNHPKIEFIWNTAVVEAVGAKPTTIGGAGGLTGVKLENLVDGSTRILSCQGLFVAIGHQPNTRIFEGQLAMDDAGYLKVEKGTTRTSVEGIFACGDVQDPTYRQAVTAAGTGCMAAIDAERWLEAQGH